MNQYDDLKKYNGKIYTGMLIGSSHNWRYPNGHWLETKVTPEKWKFSFDSLKCRDHHTKENTGAAKGTTFHWYIIADQIATKSINPLFQLRISVLAQPLL